MSASPDDAEPLCARCARTQATCCQHTDIHVTRGDVRRIEALTGSSNFCEYRPATNPAYLDQDDDPIWKLHVFQPDGTRRVLRQAENGDCILLSPLGCGLPSAGRPLICRLFPLLYTEFGIHGVAAGCPSHLLGPGEDLLGVLGMNRERAEEWRRTLYRELLEEETLPCASV